MSLTLIVGIGIFMIMVIVAIAMMQIKDPVLDIIYKGLSIIIVLVCLFLVAKATYDVKDHCELVPVNQTVTGNLTQLDYQYVCVANNNTTSSVFFQTATWFIRIVALFTVLALGYLGLRKLQDLVPRFRK